MNGLSKTRLYSIFSGMKQRCYNPQSPAYKWYGEKGITICPEWMADDGLSQFMEWALNNGYEEHLTIDRIDSCGQYSPENCRWITRSENSQRTEHFTTRPFNQTWHGPGIYYKMDVLAELKNAGYSSYRIRKEKIMGEATLQKIRDGEMVSWENINTICQLLNCQPGDIVMYTPDP